MDIPTDWQYYVDDTYYKKCKQWGYIWFWNNGHWQHSGKTEAELKPKKKKECQRKPRNPVSEETKKGKVLKAVHDKGARTSQELAIDTNLNKSSLRYACKDLCSEGKLELREGAYSIPVQISIFMGLSL